MNREIKEIEISEGQKLEFDKARFWSKAKYSEYCWEWQAYKNNRGYGVFGIGKETYLAHRVSYQFVYGKIPKGDRVLHRCDNPCCVNPSHLFLGSQYDNMWDKVIKKRWTTGRTSNYYGVHRRGESGRWRAAIRINGKYKTIGCYSSEIKAAAAYNFEVAMNKLNLPINKITL